MTNTVGNTELAIAIMNAHDLTDDEILQLMKRCPNDIKTKDKDGNYPLHLACWKIKSEKIILHLLNTFPQACTEKNNDGDYPLQVVLKWRQSTKASGYLSLVGCRYGLSEVAVIQILKTFPQAATEKAKHGSYPLHMACCCNQAEKLVLQLFKVFPQATSEKDMNGNYPLQLACEYNQSEKVVLQLLNYFPHAASEKNVKCKYPLHDACMYQSDKVVLQLLDCFPQAASKRDNFDNYPLHFACEKRQSGNIILPLVESNLLAVKANNRCNISPLHLARLSDQPEANINVLDTIMKMSDDDLQNRIDIPIIVLRNGIVNRRCYDRYQWFLRNKPQKEIQVCHVQECQSQPPAYKKQCTEKHKN
jgi:ankyrin repeat protein